MKNKLMKNNPTPEKVVPIKTKLKAVSYSLVFIILQFIVASLLGCWGMEWIYYIKETSAPTMWDYIVPLICLATGVYNCFSAAWKFNNDIKPADILQKYQNGFIEAK